MLNLKLSLIESISQARTAHLKKQKLPQQMQRRTWVQRVPPSKAAAWDEGPRLIPLHEMKRDESILGKTDAYYIGLADKVLRERHR
jgi:hypothetical protein